MLPQEYYSINPYGKDDFMSKIELQNSAYLPLSNAKESGTFTIHFWIYSDNDTDTSFDLCYGDNNKNIEIYAKHWLEVTEEIEMQEGDYLDIHFLFGGTYLIWHDKLEIGNFATDYTKAPEDMDMQIVEIRKTTNEFIQTTDETISRISETVVGIDGRVETAESEIKQNAHDISLKADKVELQGYVTFTDLGKDGTTVIDGGRIDTDSLFARDIQATGSIHGATLEGGSFRSEIEYESSTRKYKNGVSIVDGVTYFYESAYDKETGQIIPYEGSGSQIVGGWGTFSAGIDTDIVKARCIEHAGTSYYVTLYLPTKSGTLALLSDIPAIKQCRFANNKTAWATPTTETIRFLEDLNMSFENTPMVTVDVSMQGNVSGLATYNPRCEIVSLSKSEVTIAYWANAGEIPISIALNVFGI